MRNTVGSHCGFTKTVHSCWGTMCCWSTSLGNRTLTAAGLRAGLLDGEMFALARSIVVSCRLVTEVGV